MFLVINTLSKMKVLEILEYYSGQNILPLLIGLKRAFDQEKQSNKMKTEILIGIILKGIVKTS